jgi:hypothetical protein
MSDRIQLRLVRSVPVRTVEDRIATAVVMVVIAGMGAGIAFGVGITLSFLMCGGT